MGEASKFLVKKWIFGLSIVGLIFTGVGVTYLLKSSNSQEAQTQPKQVETINAVSALGRIEPIGEVIKLAPPPNMGGAKVAQLLVKEGELVKAGQIIAVLDNQELQTAAVEKAKKEIEVASANLDIVLAGAKTGEINAQKATIDRLKVELQGAITTNAAKVARLEAELQGETVAQQATIARLKAELANAATEFQRYQQLANNGAISASELDTRRVTLDTANQRVTEAQANYTKTIDSLSQQIREAKANAIQSEDSLAKQIREAEANLDRIAEVRDVDVKQAQAEKQRAIAALLQAQEELELTKVKAPTDSRVLKIHSYPGEMVDETNGIVELGQTEQMIVIAEVYESDISKVRIGQETIITSQSGAFTGELKGTVKEIGWQIGKNDVLDTDPAADVDTRVVEVEILLNPEDSSLVDKLTYSNVLVKISL